MTDRKSRSTPASGRRGGVAASSGTSVKRIRKATPAPAPQAAPGLVPIGSRLRHARLARSMLIRDVAARVGVSISLISKYENDRLLPPLTVLHALVTELGTNIGTLFDPNWTGESHVARAGSRPLIMAGGAGTQGAAGVTLERLVPHGPGRLLQGNIHIVAPGGGSMGPMRHDGDEMGYVLEGRLELGIDGTTHELGPGDSFSFPSNLEHTYRNPGPSIARVLWINTPPTF